MKFSGQITQVESNLMRREITGSRFDHFRESAEERGQCRFAWIRQQRQIGILQIGFGAMPLRHERTDTGVRILNIVNRIIGTLALGQVQIEVQMLVGLTQHIEETAGIVTDFGT